MVGCRAQPQFLTGLAILFKILPKLLIFFVRFICINLMIMLLDDYRLGWEKIQFGGGAI